VEIRSSALKHGCGPEDFRHAIMNALGRFGWWAAVT